MTPAWFALLLGSWEGGVTSPPLGLDQLYQLQLLLQTEFSRQDTKIIAINQLVTIQIS